ncbi:MAG: hypothetical protein II784_01345 [Oscillospiraceae bacterium]|nr:hypothetical protein [Oscillospiraceae bacterium]
MDFKEINTGGISFFQRLEGSSWYWGSDYTGGDLYEAEALFREKHRISKNRLVFISYPDGRLYEPLKAREGQYFGRPVLWENKIFCLLVDFPAEKIIILKCDDEMTSAQEYVKMPLSEAKDCYNLMLSSEPLTLVRQGREGRFQVIWPDKGDFEIAASESFDSRLGDELIFSKWFEDPDYREETVLRSYPHGEILENLRGTLLTMPDGQRWLAE